MAGTALLALTSFIHLFKGYQRLNLSIETEQIQLPSFSAATRETMSSEELRVVWIAFGAHLLLLSCIIVFLLFQQCDISKDVIMVLGMVPIVDCILLKLLVNGIHMGAPLLAISGLMIIIGQMPF